MMNSCGYIVPHLCLCFTANRHNEEIAPQYINLFFFFLDLLPKTPLHSPNINTSCICGCQLEHAQGEIIATGRCAGLSLWLVKVPDNHQIRLTFRYFDLYKNQQCVKIRSGETSSADLVAVSHGDITLTEVVSSGNSMLIEFMTITKPAVTSSPDLTHVTSVSPPTFPFMEIHVHGFIASYSSYGKYLTKFKLFCQ